MPLTPKDRGSIQPVHADAVKQLDSVKPDWREILQRQLQTPLGKYGTFADDEQADKLRAQAQHPEADAFTEGAKLVAGDRDIKNLELNPLPNPYGPPDRDPGQDAQDNPGVNLRDQFPSRSTEALGATATGPEVANRMRPGRKFYGR